ncbi:MAG: hypothetical protein QM757_44185 [Paludibaculum sp.]
MYQKEVRLLSVCLMAAVCPLLAQESTTYTSVALFKVKPEATGAFVDNMKKFIAPVGAKLLKEGTILGYGLDIDVFHQPGSTNADIWMEVPSFAAFGKAEEAIHAAMKASPQLTASVWAATDTNAHQDLMVRHVFSNMKKAPAGVLPYTNFYSLRLKPGKTQEFSEVFEKYMKPGYDKLVADGTIFGYSVDTEIIHTDMSAFVWILAVMPDLATKDKMLAATRETNRARSAEERKAMSEALDAITVPGSHRDSISQAVLSEMK